MSADLVLFDAAKVIDRATFAEPQNVSTGIRATFVNGRRVWNGRKTGERDGFEEEKRVEVIHMRE
ncbi:MAG: hypothetical protein IPG58_07620 [Acidobacteria bacterium]|nr:hypothetical protein [Acidobacteriota bacterium]